MSDTVSPHSRLKRKWVRTVLGLDPRLIAALGVSAAVHLSAITLFSVGVWFRVQPVEYYEFDLVRTPTPEAPLEAPELEAPYPEAMQRAGLPGPPRLTIPRETELALPEVELPTLGFANLERLRLRETSIELGARHPGFRRREEDSWSLFGREVARLREAAAGSIAALGGREKSDETPASPLQIRVPGGAAAMSFEWWSEPYDRQILFSPPIEELMLLDPGDLRRSLEFTLRVGPDGRVREVLAGPAGDRESLALALLRGIRKYRFAPMPQEDAPDQRGTLVVAPAGAAP